MDNLPEQVTQQFSMLADAAAIYGGRLLFAAVLLFGGFWLIDRCSGCVNR